MKAVLSRAPGEPETLEFAEIEAPCPWAGEVLVRVAAVGVNYPDVLIVADRYQFKPERPFLPGAEVSGTVAALGEGVSSPTVGTRILAMLGWGGMAEFVRAPAGSCIPIPDSMPFDAAAAFVMTYGTARHALADRARLKTGETLLVLGAAGGVGLAAVELGKAMGARVLAAASNREKLDAALARGAVDGIVYPAEAEGREAGKALTAAFKGLCGSGGADVVFDPVGGGYALAALRAIAWGGRHLVVGFPAGIPDLPLNLPLLKGCDVLGVFWGEAIARDPAGHRRAMADLFALHEAGRIRPTISERFPLSRAAEAVGRLAARRAIGKIVVEVG